jgi:tRNA (guanine6-N2)-methyltransferase
MRPKSTQRKKQARGRSRPKQTRRKQPTTYLLEAEVVIGLEIFARQEIARFCDTQATIVTDSTKAGTVRFRYTGNFKDLAQLNSITAVYLVHHFAVPRPRALLGHEHFHALLQDITLIRNFHSSDAFQTLHIDAAGSDSSILQRLKAELAQQTGLQVDEEAGDLLLRLRRPADKSEGWEILTRLSPRPYSTRQWRICNYEGALNATVAHVMAQLTEPTEDDVFLNIAAGSGTILIERLACKPANIAIGCDTDTMALECAKRNIEHSHHSHNIVLKQANAQKLPFKDACIDAICADLPFGHLVGSHDENLTLYPRVLQEAGRVAKSGAIFAIITHEIRLLESLLSNSQQWKIREVIRINLRGLHPRIYVLQKH